VTTKLYRDALDPSSGWFEKCARHTSTYTARTLQHIYLCDPCARRLVHEGLNDRPFVYHGETVRGFCGLCNAAKEVTLRQHFACVQCCSVVLSYQMGIVAARAVHQAWADQVQAEFPSLRLEETEAVRIEPYARKSKTKKQAAESLEVLDFHVFETSEQSNKSPLFHIELKSGPGSIDEMTEFQLDVNDYDDIVGASCQTGVPAYVFHVQVGSEYHPPTRRVVARGAWWTDVCQLRDQNRRVAARRDGEKNAEYFNRTAFAPIDTFVDELRARGFDRLRERLDRTKLALPG
jgi:hypothetical protein